jgi:hypothetical protein
LDIAVGHAACTSVRDFPRTTEEAEMSNSPGAMRREQIQNPVQEVDCPWFDPEWLLDHPDFPLNPKATANGRLIISPKAG